MNSPLRQSWIAQGDRVCAHDAPKLASPAPGQAADEFANLRGAAALAADRRVVRLSYLYAATDDTRSDRASTRWIARLCVEQQPSLSELQDAVAALSLLRHGGETGAGPLRDISLARDGSRLNAPGSPAKPAAGGMIIEGHCCATRIFAFGSAIRLPPRAGGKQQRAQRHRDPDRDGRRPDELHRVVDGEAGVEGAAGAVDVERDVLVGVVGFEME